MKTDCTDPLQDLRGRVELETEQLAADARALRLVLASGKPLCREAADLISELRRRADAVKTLAVQMGSLLCDLAAAERRAEAENDLSARPTMPRKSPGAIAKAAMVKRGCTIMSMDGRQ